MVYYSNYATEGIVFHSKEDGNEFYIISLTKDLDGETFRVEVDFDEEWFWTFKMHPSHYEIVKHTIMDVAFNCDYEDELLMELDAMFEDVFGEIVVWNECEATCNCGNGCKHCGCKE